MADITWIIPDVNFSKDNTKILNARDIPTAAYHALGGEGDLPRAALLALYHDLPPAPAWLLCEPVELIAARRDVVCLGNAHFEFEQEEANAFAATFNAYWEGTGRILYTPTPRQWLLALPEPVAFKTNPLCDVLNQPIVSGDRAWDALFSEAQMLMQAHPVNRARASLLPPVNGLWFSGEGELPVLAKQPRLRVMTDIPEVISLAKSVMATVLPVSETIQASDAPLIITLSYKNLGTPCAEDFVEIFENQWLQPLLVRERIAENMIAT
ncbi:MAG: hypothetical protein ACHQAX_05885 [Gammaproteobacteria bacterium]